MAELITYLTVAASGLAILALLLAVLTTIDSFVTSEYAGIASGSIARWLEHRRTWEDRLLTDKQRAGLESLLSSLRDAERAGAGLPRDLWFPAMAWLIPARSAAEWEAYWRDHVEPAQRAAATEVEHYLRAQALPLPSAARLARRTNRSARWGLRRDVGRAFVSPALSGLVARVSRRTGVVTLVALALTAVLTPILSITTTNAIVGSVQWQVALMVFACLGTGAGIDLARLLAVLHPAGPTARERVRAWWSLPVLGLMALATLLFWKLGLIPVNAPRSTTLAPSPDGSQGRASGWAFLTFSVACGAYAAYACARFVLSLRYAAPWRTATGLQKMGSGLLMLGLGVAFIPVSAAIGLAQIRGSAGSAEPTALPRTLVVCLVYGCLAPWLLAALAYAVALLVAEHERGAMHEALRTWGIEPRSLPHPFVAWVPVLAAGVVAVASLSVAPRTPTWLAIAAEAEGLGATLVTGFGIYAAAFVGWRLTKARRTDDQRMLAEYSRLQEDPPNE